MGKLNKDNKGFGIVELIMAIVIVILLCVFSWYVYKNHHKRVSVVTTIKTVTIKTPTTSSLSTTTTSSTATPASPYIGWKSYTTSYGLSFMYPSNWVVTTVPYTTDVAVSLIANPDASTNGSQSPRPQYNNDLLAYIMKDSQSNTSADYGALSTNDETFLNSISVNSINYSVIGETNSAVTGDPYTMFNVVTCNSGNTSCLAGMLFGSNAVDVTISSVGNGGAALIPVSQTNPDYTTIINIVKSFQYK